MSLTNPSQPTIKRLFAVSGNICAFPKCPLPLVDKESEKVTGRICHIKARNEGGARYDANQTSEERHGFENLVLMCPVHHDVIDSDEESYTVERLLEIKANHEKRFQNEQESDDKMTTALIDNSQNFVNVSTSASQNQSGGQTANQIYNYLQTPESANAWERDIQAKRDAHDLEIFRQSDAVMTEEFLERFFSCLYGDHSYKNSQAQTAENFCRFANKEKNQYLNQQINSKFNQLAENLNELNDFLGIKFSVFPKEQSYEDTRFCMEPEICLDRGTQLSEEGFKIYDELTEELNTIIQKVRGSYANYRKSVKENLFV